MTAYVCRFDPKTNHTTVSFAEGDEQLLVLPLWSVTNCVRLSPTKVAKRYLPDCSNLRVRV